MEFTCLWSKDAQQKKRKRWTDGIARFSPVTGLLSLWDQDDSTKISSMRLKPDEAATVLQADGDEARVGGVSIQIMAKISQQPQQQPQQQPPQSGQQHQQGQPSTTQTSLPSNKGNAIEEQGVPGEPRKAANAQETGANRTTSPPLGRGRTVATGSKGDAQLARLGPAGAGFRRGGQVVGTSPPSANLAGSRAGDTGAQTAVSEATEILEAIDPPAGRPRFGLGGRPSAGLKRRVLKPLVSRPPARVAATVSAPPPKHGFTNDLDLTPPSPPENMGEDTPASSGSSFPSARQAAVTTAAGSSAGNGNRVALGGAGRGRGGARRFHAPRRSRDSAPSGTNAGTDTGPRVTSEPSLVAARAHQGIGPLGGWSGGAPGGRASAGGGGGGSGGGGSGGASRVVVDALAPSPPPACRSANAAVNQEDLVLEWTRGDSPRPLLAGASLARRLHPHQREGLKVLWECLAGRGGYEGRGAILADEMGLGKTATAIALCTCVLRHRRAECRKAVVVCPSSLVKNWANEFRKWCPLGGGAVAVDQAGAAAAQLVADFKIGSPVRYPILVISYELYRNHSKIVNTTEGLGLLIADEGHRLKNSSETKTTRALKACPAVMRLVLTGTPMQNDLDEFFAVADFANPGLLGTLKSFRSRYARPIKAAWDRKASWDVADLSAERTRELGEITGKFVVRRTKDVIRGSLPPALEVVIFCRPSPQQLSLYEACVATSGARALLVDILGEELDSDDGGQEKGVGATRHLSAGLRGVLPLISSLRRLCNHPDLVAGRDSQDGADSIGGGGGGGSGGDSSSCDIIVGDGRGTLREDLDGDDGDGDDGGDSSNDVWSDAEEAVEKLRPLSAKQKENNAGVAVPGTAVASPANGKGSGLAYSGGRKLVRAWKVPRGSGAAKANAPVVTRVNTAGNTSKLAAASAEPPKYETEASGKVVVLEALLKTVRRAYPGDKVVITSNFTSALDVLGCLAERNDWGFLRLDGGTSSNLRQSLVDRFNKAPPKDLFLFFLSARAGGIGLNLVGANRIVLFDSDWNPATDEQAMARVWRLGQTKEVSMYRLLCTGTLEESILQRQIFKGALYDLIHDSNDPCLPSSRVGSTSCSTNGDDDDGRPGERKGRRPSGGDAGHGRGGGAKGGAAAASRGFSQEELKELFVLKKTTNSDTYDKLKQRLATTTAMATAASPRDRSCSSRRFQGSPLILRDGSTNSGDGGSFASGSRPPTASGDIDWEMEEAETTADPTLVDERWKVYGGPSDVSDKALRRALEESCVGTGGGGDGKGNASAVAGHVVTFVREVLRGGGPAAPRRENGADRDPVAAHRSRERSDGKSCEGIGGENTPPV